MNKTHEYRRQNLRKLIDDNGGPVALSARLGYKNASFLVQMTGPNPDREVTERSARNFEARLGLPEGALDQPVELPMGAAVPRRRIGRASLPDASAAQPMGAQTLAGIIRLVGHVCDDEHVALPTQKFADIVALAVVDSAEHANALRQDHIEQLVRLLK